MTKNKSYDQSVIKKLNAADWREIMPRLIKYSRSKEGLLTKLKSELGYKDILQEAILRVYGKGKNGKFRNWNPEKYPDLAQFIIFIIKEVVRQEISDMTGYKKEQLCWEDASGEERELPVDNCNNVTAHHSSTPEDVIIKEEAADRLSAKIDKFSNGDEELGMVILCISEGITKASKIAEEIGLPTKEVYNLKRKIRRRLEHYNDASMGKS